MPGNVPSGSTPMAESPNLIPSLVSSESSARAEIEDRFAGNSKNVDLLSGIVPSGSQPTTESQILTPRQVSAESMSRAEIEARFAGTNARLDTIVSMLASIGHNPSSSQSRTALTSGERTTSALSTNLSDYKPEAVANFHDSGQEGNSVGQATSKPHSSMLDGTSHRLRGSWSHHRPLVGAGARMAPGGAAMEA